MTSCKYNDDPEFYNILAEGLAREGKVEKEIARELNISETTFNNWKKKYPEFRKALQRGKKPVDYNVEKALLKRAKGFEHVEFKTSITEVGDKKTKNVEKFIKYVPPDVSACLFWLKNRQKQKWQDKPEVSQSDSERIDTKKVYLETLKKWAEQPSSEN